MKSADVEIDAQGFVEPGVYELHEPIVVESGDVVRGRGTVLLRPERGVHAFEIAGQDFHVSGFEVQGGEMGLNCRNGSARGSISDIAVRETRLSTLFAAQVQEIQVERCFLADSGDNVVQVEHGGIYFLNCAMLRSGPTLPSLAPPNKVLDCSHHAGASSQNRVRVIHCTILDYNSHAVGLDGWVDGQDLVFANNLVLSGHGWPGTAPFAVLAENLVASTVARIEGNVVWGTIVAPALDQASLARLNPQPFQNEFQALHALGFPNYRGNGWGSLQPSARAPVDVFHSAFRLRFDALLRPRDPEHTIAGALVR